MPASPGALRRTPLAALSDLADSCLMPAQHSPSKPSLRSAAAHCALPKPKFVRVGMTDVSNRTAIQRGVKVGHDPTALLNNFLRPEPLVLHLAV